MRRVKIIVGFLIFLSLSVTPTTVFAVTNYGKGVIYYTENYLRNYSGTNSIYNWPIPKPSVPTPETAVHAAYFDPNGIGYTVIKGNTYWYRKQANAPWISSSLQSLFYTSGNAADVGIPVSDIDSAYFDTSGGYTVIDGDRYWYRTTNTSGWFTGTLQSAYSSSPNWQTANVSLTNIDSAYFDASGGYTVIDGDRYWYRSANAADWITGTLQSAFSTSPNWQSASVPISNLDSAYFQSSGLYTVVKGDKYWYRFYSTDEWRGPDTLVNAYAPLIPGQISGTECSRYVDLTQKEIDTFVDLGLGHIILGFGPVSWYNLAPNRPSQPTAWNDPGYNFAKLDEWIGRLQQRNITPVLQLWGTPTWASGKAKPDNAGCINNPYIGFEPYAEPPLNLNDYADFVGAVATRYDGTKIANPFNTSQKLQVNIFSIWNEPNWTDFWRGTPQQYLAMANSAYDRIKSVRPTSTIWGGNLLGNTSGPEEFLAQMNNSLKFDVFALHPYPINFNATPTDVSNRSLFAIGNLEYFMQRFDSNSNYRGKPIMLTEIGYRSNWESQFATSDITLNEEVKANYIAQTLAEINRINTSGLYYNRITGVTNNVLYNPWQWWSTGLMNYYNSSTGVTDLTEKIAAYNTFKSWQLSFAPEFSMAQFKTLLINFLTGGDSLYNPIDGKINAMDAAYVLKWLVP